MLLKNTNINNQKKNIKNEEPLLPYIPARATVEQKLFMSLSSQGLCSPSTEGPLVLIPRKLPRYFYFSYLQSPSC